MEKENHVIPRILVIGEVKKNHILPVTFELAGKAAELARKIEGAVDVLLFYDRLDEPVDSLFQAGADRALLVEDSRLGLFNQEIAVKIGLEVLRRYPAQIVLAAATTSGRTFLPAMAAILHTGLTADCTGLDIEPETGLLLQTRPAIGGNVMATIKTPTHRPQMATVRPRTFPKPVPVQRKGAVEQLELPESCFSSKIVPLSHERISDDYTNIQDLDVVVTGGKGLKKPENFALLEKLAKLLGGGVGATRPTVEAKWIDYPHQVGLSGKVVSPKFYLAAGVSGAVQHLAGMQTAEFIVAINKDPEAGIFKIADIGLCGDLFEILPELIAALEKERGEGR